MTVLKEEATETGWEGLLSVSWKAIWRASLLALVYRVLGAAS